MLHRTAAPILAATAQAALLAATCLSPAAAQTSFLAPDGHNRFPAVTIFCPSGTGVAPCSFGGGGGGGGGPLSLTLGGSAVSASNRFPVTDAMLDSLISGGALSVALAGTPTVNLAAGGAVNVGNFPAVQATSQSGSWTVGLASGTSLAIAALPALPAGANAIGSVSVSNLPATQNVAGTLAVASLPALPAGTNTIGAVTIAGTPNFTCQGCGGTGAGGGVTQGAGAAANPWWMQGLGTAGSPTGGVTSVQGVPGGSALPVSGTLAVASLPALPTGANAIGSVSVSNLPATQTISGAVTQAGSWTVGLASGASLAVASLPALPTGANAIGTVAVSNLPATQAVSGTLAVASLPALPTGTNTIGAVTIAGTPSFTCQGCGGTGAGGSVTQGAGAAANPWWMQGLGSAGSPAGGITSVQGVPGGSALPVSGTLAVSTLPALAAGSNAIGTVTVSNLPATQPVSGTLAVASLPALPAGANTIGAVSIAGGSVGQGAGAAANAWWMQGQGVAGTPAGGVLSVQGVPGGAAQSVSGTLAVSALPALPAGSNAIGSVSVSNLPATQPVSGTLAVSALPALSAGGNAIGSVSVSNLPATQPVSAAALPLPAGAATSAVQAPVAPAAATATATTLLGCQAATALPVFTAGQQGAVPCDTSGRPYVVTVPSANNVPSYLQAVSGGGASVFRAINAANSTMATAVKSGSGMVFGYEGCNSGTAAVFLRLFPLGTAPTVGGSTPQITKLLPPGACQTMAMSLGLVFANGIAMDVTSGSMADTDATAVAAANQVAVEVYYK